MALNDPDAGSTLRKPRGVVKVNGVVLPGFEEIEVNQNPGHFASDSFEVRYPLFGMPSTMDFAWWSSQTDIEVEVLVGVIGANGYLTGLTSLIVGPVDEVSSDLIGDDNRACLSLRGRDYSGVFIDSVITQQFENVSTASAIAAQIIGNHPGLTPKITPTKDSVESYYGSDGGRLAVHQTEWDFLTALAQHEGYQILVQGKTVYFGPPPVPDTTNPYLLKYVPPGKGRSTSSSNMTQLRLKRALTLARDVIVIVESFNYATGTTVRGTAKAVNTQRANRSGATKVTTPQTYTFNIPGLTKGQAQQAAEAKIKEITQHERLLEGRIPGDTALTPQSVIRLVGSGTDYDQVYYLDRLSHVIDLDGYAMGIRAKNHSTYSTVPM